jgi:hypothetical protein
MNTEKGSCDTIHDCINSIKLHTDRICKEKAEISQQLEETSKKLREAEKVLPPSTPSPVKKIVTGAIHTVAEIAEEIKGSGGLTKNFSKFRNVSSQPTMNLKRGQFQPGLGGPSVMASSAEISPNAPVGGSWYQKMSKSKGKPYWVSTTNSTKSSWVKPVNAVITMAGGRRTRRMRKMRKSRSKSRKSRR